MLLKDNSFWFEPHLRAKEDIIHLKKSINAIYFLYNKDEELVYVGISKKLKSRLKYHFSNQGIKEKNSFYFDYIEQKNLEILAY